MTFLVKALAIAIVGSVMNRHEKKRRDEIEKQQELENRIEELESELSDLKYHEEEEDEFLRHTS